MSSAQNKWKQIDIDIGNKVTEQYQLHCRDGFGATTRMCCTFEIGLLFVNFLFLSLSLFQLGAVVTRPFSSWNQFISTALLGLSEQVDPYTCLFVILLFPILRIIAKWLVCFRSFCWFASFLPHRGKCALIFWWRWEFVLHVPSKRNTNKNIRVRILVKMKFQKTDKWEYSEKVFKIYWRRLVS